MLYEPFQIKCGRNLPIISFILFFRAAGTGRWYMHYIYDFTCFFSNACNNFLGCLPDATVPCAIKTNSSIRNSPLKGITYFWYLLFNFITRLGHIFFFNFLRFTNKQILFFLSTMVVTKWESQNSAWKIILMQKIYFYQLISLQQWKKLHWFGRYFYL